MHIPLVGVAVVGAGVAAVGAGVCAVAAWGHVCARARAYMHGTGIYPGGWGGELGEEEDYRTGTCAKLYIGSISASPTACSWRGYGRAGTPNDHLGTPPICAN